MRTLLILNVFILLFINSLGSEYSYNCKFYKAYINSRMDHWEELTIDLENKYLLKEDNIILEELLFAQYALIAYKIAEKQNIQADFLLTKAEKYLSDLLLHKPNDSRLLALKAAFYGFRIGLNKSNAVYYGPLSLYYINESLEKDKSNPTAWIEKGNKDFYMPKIIGGSKTEAIKSYEKAVKLFEMNNRSHCNWLYLNTLAQLGVAYEEINEKNKAREIYNKILSIEPEFTWVRDALMPNLINRL